MLVPIEPFRNRRIVVRVQLVQPLRCGRANSRIPFGNTAKYTHPEGVVTDLHIDHPFCAARQYQLKFLYVVFLVSFA